MGDEPRLLSARVLQNFVRETSGKWDQEEWRQLIERIRRIGFFKIEERRIGQLVDDNREQWLACDNSAGSPAPARPQSITAPKAAPRKGAKKPKKKAAKKKASKRAARKKTK